MKKNNKICVLTSAHMSQDIRIFHKQCRSLVKAGYQVIEIAQNEIEEIVDGIKIIPLTKPKNRLRRMTINAWRLLKLALNENAKIYHLHDPELLPVGIKLKRLGKKVIFDFHEDVPVQIMAKSYMNKFQKNIFSKLVSKYEQYACKKFDYIVSATPFIKNKFLKINQNTIDINNSPILNEFSDIVNWNNKENEICYIGAISKNRGIQESLVSLGYIKNNNCRLNLAGLFENSELEQSCKKKKEWEKVDYKGWLNREQVSLILQRSRIGLVLLHPIINYIDSYPIKLFEYMAAGIPVIASNFPLWKKIIDGHKCGLTVDPMKPQEIADAIDWLLAHPQEAEQMGINGRLAVIEKYNWENEEKKLLDLYEHLLE